MSYHSNLEAAVTPQHTLRDYPFQHEFLYIFGTDHDVALVELRARLNNAIGASCWLDIGNNCYRVDEVRTVVFTYINLVNNGEIEEYDREKRPEKVAEIENRVIALSGHAPGRVKAILYHLYFGTLAGELKTDVLLRPKTAKQHAEWRDTPDGIDSVGTETPLDQAKPWIIGALVVVGMFSAGKLLSAVAELTD